MTAPAGGASHRRAESGMRSPPCARLFPDYRTWGSMLLSVKIE
jgi:hypothetical protein